MKLFCFNLCNPVKSLSVSSQNIKEICKGNAKKLHRYENTSFKKKELSDLEGEAITIT